MGKTLTARYYITQFSYRLACILYFFTKYDISNNFFHKALKYVDMGAKLLK